MSKRRYAYYRTLKRRILFITLTVSLFMGLLIGCVSCYLYYNYQKQTLLSNIEISLKYAADTIDRELSGLFTLVNWCQSSQAVADYAVSSNPSVTFSTHDLLNEQYLITSGNEYIRRIIITRKDGGFIQVVPEPIATQPNVTQIISTLPYLSSAINSLDFDFSMGLVADPLDGSLRFQMLPVLRPVYDLYTSEVTGYILMEIDPALFTDALASVHLDSELSCYLNIEPKNYRYQDGALTETFRYTLNSQGPMEGYVPYYEDSLVYSGISDDGIDYCHVIRTLSSGNFRLTCRVPFSLFVENLQPFFWIILLVLMLVLIFAFCMFFYLHRVVTKPVNQLKQQIIRISGGDFSKNPSIEWRTELGDIGRGINEMSENIVQLLEKRVAAEKEKQEYEYRLLQSQINPHFLYNTLNSIKWMATIQNAPGIAQMTTSLSRLLKSIAKGRQVSIPVRTEFSLLDDYFTIQKYRYGGAITLDYQIDDESLLDCQILRFTLQPIAENAIFHGIEPTGAAGVIQVRLYAPSANQIQIDITDNGVGMAEDTIQHLLEDDEKNKSSFFRDFGISSVHKRIQYEFGPEYGLSIQSKLDVFTTVSVHLPKLFSPSEAKAQTSEPSDKQQ